MTTQQAKLAAQEILEQSEIVKTAFQKLILRGYQPTDISFENNIIAGYTLSTCTIDDCKIFATSGGALNWLSAATIAANGNNWIYSGVSAIEDNGASSEYDIVMILPNVNDEVCRNLNLNLGITSALSDPIPVTDDTTISIQQLNDTYPIATSANVFDGTDITGNEAVCVQVGTMSGAYSGTNQFFFVQTVYAG